MGLGGRGGGGGGGGGCVEANTDIIFHMGNKIACSKEDLTLCPGLGPQKVNVN